MKYTLYLCILTALFALGLSGCGDEKNSPAPEQSRSATETNATAAPQAAPQAAPSGENNASGTNSSAAAPASQAPGEADVTDTPPAAQAPAAEGASSVVEAEGASSVAEKDLLHRHFLLKSVNGEEYSRKERLPELLFTDEFRIAGGFCNRIMGQASLHDGVLSVGPLASTRMHCPEEDLNKLEQSFIQNLEKGVRLTFDGRLLTLKGEDVELVFELQEAAAQEAQ